MGESILDGRKSAAHRAFIVRRKFALARSVENDRSMRSVHAAFGLVNVMIRINRARCERIHVVFVDHSFVSIEIRIEVRSEDCGTTRRASGKTTRRSFLHARFRLRTPSSIRIDLVFGVIAIPQALEGFYVEALVADGARTDVIEMPRITGSEPLETSIRQNRLPRAVLLNIKRQARFVIRGSWLCRQGNAATTRLVPAIKHVLLRNCAKRRIEGHCFARIRLERRGEFVAGRLFHVRKRGGTNREVAMIANGNESIRIDTARFSNDLLRQTLDARRRTARTRSIQDRGPGNAFVDRIDWLRRFDDFRIAGELRWFRHTARQERRRCNGKRKANFENRGGRSLHASKAVHVLCRSICTCFEVKMKIAGWINR